METEIRDNVAESRYEIHAEGRLAGFATYRRGEHSITFIHTEVDPEVGGQGLGSTLVSGALDQAREQGLAVLPMCPFVKALIKDRPEFLDLVPEDQRGRFGL